MSTSLRRARRRAGRAKKEKGDGASPFPSTAEPMGPELHFGRHHGRGRLAADLAANLPTDFPLHAADLALDLPTDFALNAAYLADNASDFALGFPLGSSFRCHFSTSRYIGEKGDFRLPSLCEFAAWPGRDPS